MHITKATLLYILTFTFSSNSKSQFYRPFDFSIKQRQELKRKLSLASWPGMTHQGFIERQTEFGLIYNLGFETLKPLIPVMHVYGSRKG